MSASARVDARARSGSTAMTTSISVSLTSARCWPSRAGPSVPRRRRRMRPGTAPTDAELAPLVLSPGKIVCVGLNYRSHILEMGRELPEHPTLFAKFADALVGANDDIVLPPESNAMDWEAELVVVIGRAVRRADDDAGRRGDRRVHGHERRDDARLAVPHRRMAARQDVRGHDAVRPRAGDARRARRGVCDRRSR